MNQPSSNPVQMQIQTPFLDRKTSEEIGFDALWNMIHPLHELGFQYKKNVQPFLPGDETVYHDQVNWFRVLIDYAAVHPEWRTACETALRQLPTSEHLVDLLMKQNVLHSADIFILKQWLLTGKRLKELIDQLKKSMQEQVSHTAIEQLVKLDLFPWDEWLQVLDPGMQCASSFSMRDLQDPVWNALDDRRAAIDHALFRIKLEQSKRIYEAIGIRPNRNRQVIFSKQQGEGDHQLLQWCQHTEDLRYVMETYHEVIFEVIDSEEMESLEQSKLDVQNEIDIQKHNLLRNISAKLWKQALDMKKACGEIGKFDYFLAIEALVKRWDRWCWGAFCCDSHSISNSIQIRMCWHPVYRMSLQQRHPERSWTPISLELDQVNVLTGPNMGGKSVALKTIGLLQTLFQYGLPIPAEHLVGSFVWWVRYHGGDDSDAEQGISSFGAEMIRLADVLQLKEHGLVLLDEVARSTNPQEGGALATAIVEGARERHAITVCASHFAQVGQVPGTARFQVKGLRDLSNSFQQLIQHYTDTSELLRQLQQQMDYEIVRVSEGEVPQYALTIAHRLGMPDHIVNRGLQLLQEGSRQN